MTPRSIESEFSELLHNEVKEAFPLDLTIDGPLMSRPHPKVLWTKLQFLHNPEHETSDVEVPGWSYQCFENFLEAQESYPEIEFKFDGRPWAIHQFLKSNSSKAIIDFLDLGTIVLSKEELKKVPKTKLHHHVLPVFLNYALSPELWGPVGKWTRFHERLHELFKKHELLSGQDSVGYYPLKASAAKLQDFGFQGTNLDKTYLLVLPWSFSLTALNKLEEIVIQEF